VTPSHRRDAVTSEPVTTSLFDLETDIAAPDLARLDQRRAGILTISQRTWTALISIFSLGLMTLFSSQPVAFAENFPSRPRSNMILLLSVLRRISGRSLFWGPPVYWSRNYFATEIANGARLRCAVTARPLVAGMTPIVARMYRHRPAVLRL
jgi:hypothetical protein